MAKALRNNEWLLAMERREFERAQQLAKEKIQQLQQKVRSLTKAQKKRKARRRSQRPVAAQEAEAGQPGGGFVLGASGRGRSLF